MRTTIDLPNDLFRQVKSKAALRGETLKNLSSRRLKRKYPLKFRPVSFRVKLPLIKSKKPKSLSLTNAEIENLLA